MRKDIMDIYIPPEFEFKPTFQGIYFPATFKQKNKTIRHFDILIRRGYFFLKIFSFVINVDIGRKERQDDRLFGIYYYRLSLVTILLSNRRFIFKIESRITPKETCPICGLFYQTFAELENGAHPDCEGVIELTRGGK